MSRKKMDGRELDDLIRRAFADDLPAGVEAGMRERADLSRAERASGHSRPDRSWLSRRAAWAALSVLMLVSGALLQGLGSRNLLSDRITEIKIEFASAESASPSGVAPEGAPIIRRKSNG